MRNALEKNRKGLNSHAEHPEGFGVGRMRSCADVLPSARMWRQHCARCQEPKHTVLEFRGVKSRLRDEGIGEIRGTFRRTLSGWKKSLTPEMH